jgi:hypothetical protein
MFRFARLLFLVFICLFYSFYVFAQGSFDSFQELEGNTDSKMTNKNYEIVKQKKVSGNNIVNTYVNKYGNIKVKQIRKNFPKNLKPLDNFKKEINYNATNKNNNSTNNQNNKSYVDITSIVNGTPIIANGEFVYKNTTNWAIAGSKHYSFSFVNPAYPDYSHMRIYREGADNDAKNDAYAYCNSEIIKYKSTSSSIYILPVVENFKQDFILKETKCCDRTRYYNIIYQSGDIVCYFYQYPE